jgi:hypothetical protein
MELKFNAAKFNNAVNHLEFDATITTTNVCNNLFINLNKYYAEHEYSLVKQNGHYVVIFKPILLYPLRADGNKVIRDELHKAFIEQGGFSNVHLKTHPLSQEYSAYIVKAYIQAA